MTNLLSKPVEDSIERSPPDLKYPNLAHQGFPKDHRGNISKLSRALDFAFIGLTLRCFNAVIGSLTDRENHTQIGQPLPHQNPLRHSQMQQHSNLYKNPRIFKMIVYIFICFCILATAAGILLNVETGLTLILGVMLMTTFYLISSLIAIINAIKARGPAYERLVAYQNRGNIHQQLI